MNARLIALLFAVLPLTTARADVKLNELFTDNMVLQADREDAIWGTASPGEEITIFITSSEYKSETKVLQPGEDGSWRATLPSMGPTASESAALTIRIVGKNELTLKNVLVGEVWICSGQSNMEWSLRQSFESKKDIESAKDPLLRLYSVPHVTSMKPLENVPHSSNKNAQFTHWYVSSPETVPGFSAVAYYFGKHLREARKVPVGLIHTSWGGTPAEAWTSRPALDAEPTLRYYHDNLAKAIKNYDPQKAKEQYEAALQKWEQQVAEAKEPNKSTPPKPRLPAAPGTSPGTPSVLYNAMIAPLIPYGIAGAIWYQGESNAGKAFEYRTLFATMIQDWRKNWNQGDFPFLFVQLAPYDTKAPWAELREAQFMALALPRTGMAVITDVGEAKDIHPKKKEPVGTRLALAARAIAYGEQIEYSGPVFEAVRFEGEKAIVKFSHAASGLEAKDGKLTGFTIAGDDQKFVEATAEITGADTIGVSAPGVSKPESVRFGWHSYPKVNLWNRAGLPATPFRTDTWPVATQPK